MGCFVKEIQQVEWQRWFPCSYKIKNVCLFFFEHCFCVYNVEGKHSRSNENMDRSEPGWMSAGGRA